MSIPSPFEIGRQIGTNFDKSFTRVRDENAIEGILENAMRSGDPAVLQNSIGKILSQVSPERQGPAVQYLQNAFNNVQKKQEQQRQEMQGKTAAQQAGYTYGVPDSVAAQQVRDKAKGGRLAQYGLGGDVASNGMPNPSSAPPNVPNPLPDGQYDNTGVPPQQTPQGQIPQNNQTKQPPQSAFEKFLNSRTKGQLIELTGHPDREVSIPAKALLDRLEAQEKLDQKDKQKLREEELTFHKESEKYDEQIFKQTQTAKKQRQTVADIKKAINSGNVKPYSLANIFKGFGKIGDKISEALINNDQATLLASIPQLLEGWKEVFGVRLSDADLRLLQDKLPSIGKSPEANKAIIKVLEKYGDMTLLRSQIARQIKQENNGLRPLGYADKIEERFDQMVMPVKIINPNNGKVIEIPAYKVSEAIKGGGRLANEQ